jgi:hypothetical protein
LTIVRQAFIASDYYAAYTCHTIKPDTYHSGKDDEGIPEQYTTISGQSIARSPKHSMLTLTGVVQTQPKQSVSDICSGLIPALFLLLVPLVWLSSRVHVFNWLATPLVPLFELLQT